MSEMQGVPAQAPNPTQGQVQPRPEKFGYALVLSGGSIKGAYQIGAIVEVLQTFRPTAIYGISIGALNGGILASYVGEQILAGQPPDLLAAARRVERYWYDNVTDFKKLGRKRFMPLCLWEALIGNFKGMTKMDGVIGMAKKEIRPANLRAAANEADLKFYAGTLNLTKGRYEDKAGTEDQIVEYIIASGMQPIVMPMSVIRPIGSKPPTFRQRIKEILASRRYPHVDAEDSWVDGGVHNVNPIDSAIDAGYTKIVCIMCQPRELGPGSFRGRLNAIADRLVEVVTHQHMVTDMMQVLNINYWVDKIEAVPEAERSDAEKAYVGEFRKIDLWIIDPKEDLGVDFRNFTPDAIKTMILQGHCDAYAEVNRPHLRRRAPGGKLGERAPSLGLSGAEAAARFLTL